VNFHQDISSAALKFNAICISIF